MVLKSAEISLNKLSQITNITRSPRKVLPDLGKQQQGCTGAETEVSQKCRAEETKDLVAALSAMKHLLLSRQDNTYSRDVYD